MERVPPVEVVGVERRDVDGRQGERPHGQRGLFIEILEEKLPTLALRIQLRQLGLIGEPTADRSTFRRGGKGDPITKERVDVVVALT